MGKLEEIKWEGTMNRQQTKQWIDKAIGNTNTALSRMTKTYSEEEREAFLSGYHQAHMQLWEILATENAVEAAKKEIGPEQNDGF